MCFWDTEACKSILVDPQNKPTYTEYEHNRPSLTWNNTMVVMSQLSSAVPGLLRVGSVCVCVQCSAGAAYSGSRENLVGGVGGMMGYGVRTPVLRSSVASLARAPRTSSGSLHTDGSVTVRSAEPASYRSPAHQPYHSPAPTPRSPACCPTQTHHSFDRKKLLISPRSKLTHFSGAVQRWPCDAEAVGAFWAAAK